MRLLPYGCLAPKQKAHVQLFVKALIYSEWTKHSRIKDVRKAAAKVPGPFGARQPDSPSSRLSADEKSRRLLWHALAFKQQPPNLICRQKPNLWLAKKRGEEVQKTKQNNNVTRHQRQVSLSMARTSAARVKAEDRRESAASCS